MSNLIDLFIFAAYMYIGCISHTAYAYTCNVFDSYSEVKIYNWSLLLLSGFCSARAYLCTSFLVNVHTDQKICLKLKDGLRNIRD